MSTEHISDPHLRRFKLSGINSSCIYYRDFGGVGWQSKMKRIYRSQTVLHQVLNQFCMNIIPFAVLIGYLFTISGGFIIFRSDNYVFRTLLLVFSFSCCGAFSLVYKLMYQITLHSAEFLHSFESSTAPKKAVDQRFFMSCKPLHMYLGRYCQISRNTFPSVMHEIILNALITLLLTVRNTN